MASNNIVAFGITRWELTKMLMMVGALVFLMATSTVLIFQMNDVVAEQARQAQIQSDVNERLVNYGLGQQQSLEDRVDKVEAQQAQKPVVVVPKVIVVAPTPAAAPTLSRDEQLNSLGRPKKTPAKSWWSR